MKQIETFFVGLGLVMVAAPRWLWHALLLTVLFPLLWAYRVGEHHMRGRSKLWLEKLSYEKAANREMATTIFWGLAGIVAFILATYVLLPRPLFELRGEETVDLGLPGAELDGEYMEIWRLGYADGVFETSIATSRK